MFSAVHFSAVHFSAVHFSAVHFSAVHFRAVHFSAVHFSAVMYRNSLPVHIGLKHLPNHCIDKLNSCKGVGVCVMQALLYAEAEFKQDL